MKVVKQTWVACNFNGKLRFSGGAQRCVVRVTVATVLACWFSWCCRFLALNTYALTRSRLIAAHKLLRHQ
eukprot:SAG31_NODE_34582_length_331_cov_1.116379_1_plen_69_part_01